LTGRVKRTNLLPFENTKQDRNDAFYDDFESPMLHLEWNFRRVPLENTYSLSARTGFLRLFLKPETIKERGRCSLMGIRQGESDFTYSAGMEFSAKKEKAEAGISMFQKDDNFINLTVSKDGGNIVLKLVMKNQNEQEILKQEILENYKAEIILKVESKDQIYRYFYSLDRGKSCILFAETGADLVLNRGYTGAYLGVYATGNGSASKEYADFDWIDYKGYQRF